MYNKKENNKKTTLKIILSIFIFSIIFVFKNKFSEKFIYFKNEFFSFYRTSQEISQTEKDELSSLRLKNNVLEIENRKLHETFLADNSVIKPSFVKFLLGPSTLYGDFYVSLPDSKTVYVGMNLYTSNNIVVAQVDNIFPNSLRATYLGQNKSFIATAQESGESLELRSLGSGLYFAKTPSTNSVNVGEPVVLKGFPKAIVGEVVEIKKGEDSISNVFVRSPQDLSKVEIFYVSQ